MSTKLQILLSMFCHLATFILLGLGSVYGSQWLTGGALISLMFGLFFGKEALEHADLVDSLAEFFEEEGFFDDDQHLADVLHENDD